MNQAEYSCVNIYLLTKDIAKGVNKINWFVHHANRCKKVEDMTKLTCFIVIEITVVEKLVLQLNEHTTDIINQLIPQKR